MESEHIEFKGDIGPLQQFLELAMCFFMSFLTCIPHFVIKVSIIGIFPDLWRLEASAPPEIDDPANRILRR